VKKIAFLATILLALCAGSAGAIDIQNFQPALGTQNVLTLYSSSPLSHGQFGVAVISNYAADPLVFKLPEDEKLRVVEQLVTTEFEAAASRETSRPSGGGTWTSS